MLKIPNTGSHTIVWTHNTTCTDRNGWRCSGSCCVLPRYPGKATWISRKVKEVLKTNNNDKCPSSPMLQASSLWCCTKSFMLMWGARSNSKKLWATIAGRPAVTLGNIFCNWVPLTTADTTGMWTENKNNIVSQNLNFKWAFCLFWRGFFPVTFGESLAFLYKTCFEMDCSFKRRLY